MKRKYIDFKNYSQQLKATSQWSFGSASPFPQVSTPKALFVAFAGVISPVSGPSMAMGTLEVCRSGKEDQVKFNFDQYVFYSTGTPSILEIVETLPQKLNHHWANSYPPYIQGSAPEWIKGLLGK